MTAKRFYPERDGRLTLQNSRDTLSTGFCDADVEQDVIRILTAATDSADDGSALADLVLVLEGIRQTPEGDLRVARMNAFVRTLGRADRLATFLDIMRRSMSSKIPVSRELAERSRSGRMHCIYGWAGQTLMLASEANPTPGTTPAGEGVIDAFRYPVPEWHLSTHIWQPHPLAAGFASTKRWEPDAIVEPPHSHPFSFASYVAIGEMHQSVYIEDPAENGSGTADERYYDIVLERVDGVWPPHREYRPTRVRTVEDRIRLRTGASYFMPAEYIHDVEVNRLAARNTPAITLFLSTETTRIPNVYMVPLMAEFHYMNPDVKETATALDEHQWDAKFAAVADYLRGKSEYLRLHEVFDCTSTYGFMNV